jgi:hypothetical protein
VSNDNEHGKQEFTQAQANEALVAFIYKRIEELDEMLVKTGDDWIEGKFEAYCEVRDFLAEIATPSPAAVPTASGNAAVTGAQCEHEWGFVSERKLKMDWQYLRLYRCNVCQTAEKETISPKSFFDRD